MEEITVTIKDVLEFPRGGAKIKAHQHGKDKPVRIFASGNARVLRNSRYRRLNDVLPVPGESFVVSGRFEDHPLHGIQFIPDKFKPLMQEDMVDNTNVLVYLRNAEQFRNIGFGPARIDALDDAFPNGQLAKVLDANDSIALTAVPGITDIMARRVLAGWHDYKAESDLMTYLDVNRFDRRISRKLITAWGVDARQHLEANPYRMLAFEHNWNTVDGYARKLKVGESDDRRYVAAVAHCLWVAMDTEGHTLGHARELRVGVARLLGSDLAAADRAIQLALAKEVIKGDAANGYQPIGAYAMEKTVAKRIIEIREQSFPRQQGLMDWSNATLEFIEEKIAEYEESERLRLKMPQFKLNDKQKLAVHCAIVEPVSLLTGYAGCGKTTVIRAVFHVAHALNAEIYQMAVAGRAAQRMRETTGQNAYTIVGFINQLANKQIEFHSTPLIVIDESSMVDLPLLYWLLSKLPQDVRLLFVGDPAQLPPVSFGLVFHQLVDSAKLNKLDSLDMVELDQVFRQDETTGIPMIAKAIREGSVPSIPAYGGMKDGVSFIPCSQFGIPQKVLETLVTLGGPGKAQVLGSMRAGVREVNSICSKHYVNLNHQDTYISPFQDVYSVNDPVIYLENNYDEGVWNGSLGKVIAVDSKADVVTCQFDDKVIYTVDKNNLRNLDLAYAITTHKSQGSQFERVIVPVQGDNPLLDRSLIYTALTRGVRQVVFIGEEDAFTQAIAAPSKAAQRQVGFWKN